MRVGRSNSFSLIVLCVLLLGSGNVTALKFEPGVSAGVKHTDNATLVSANEQEDQIITTAVAASLASDEGALVYDAKASFRKEEYTQGSFSDQRFFSLGLHADWEMIKNRFSWFLDDRFRQRTLRTINSNTPDNLQDSNVFILGARINAELSKRNSLKFTPTYSKFYFEQQPTNNNQYSLVVNWNYQMFRLKGIGLRFSTRTVDYFQQEIADTNFSSLGLVYTSNSQYSRLSLNLGTTKVTRDTGDEKTGFSGKINWLTDITARSKIKILASTSLTDTSSIALNTIGGDNVQVTTDVVRDKVLNLTYSRDDSLLHTSLLLGYRKVEYERAPLDRIVRLASGKLDYPATPVLTVGSYFTYAKTDQIITGRLDTRYTIGGNLRYHFSRKLSGVTNLSFRKKSSTTSSQNYEEVGVYVGLTYGFGA